MDKIWSYIYSELKVNPKEVNIYFYLFLKK